MERGWAINIGGGFHHCSRERGGGFCVYADISLCIQHLLQHRSERVKTAMIVDLDAHQVFIVIVRSVAYGILLLSIIGNIENRKT